MADRGQGSGTARRRSERDFQTDSNTRHDGLQLRVPPQSVEAEQAVLGGLMLAPEAFPLVSALVKREDFYRRDHQLIFQAIAELEDKAKPFDAVTLGEWFQAQGLAETVANGSYLIELASTTPSAANITAYAEIVRSKAQLRHLIDIGTEVVNNGFHPDGRDVEELIADAGAKIEGVVRSTGAVGMSLKDAMRDAMFEMEEAFYAPEGYRPGLSTGNPDLDDAISYLQPGRVYGIGGRPKMGKSTLAGDIAEHNAVADGKHVHVFTYEQPAKEMAKIFVAKRARVNYRAMQLPKMLHDEDWQRIQEATGKMRKAPLTFHDEGDNTIDRIAAVCQVAKARGELDLVVIDQLNLMPTPDLGNRNNEIGYVTVRVKRLATRLGVPVILVFQLNRANETGGKVRPPRASDARDSGNIEQDLDCMMLVHRPSYYDKGAERGCRLEVAIQRNGESGKVLRLEDELEFSRFGYSKREWVDGRAMAAEPESITGF